MNNTWSLVLYWMANNIDLLLDAQAYSTAVALQPRYCQAHCNMGVIYKERGDLETAVAAYEAALAAAPNYGIVQSNMSIALTDLGTRRKLEGRVQVRQGPNSSRHYVSLHISCLLFVIVVRTSLASSSSCILSG